MKSVQFGFIYLGDNLIHDLIGTFLDIDASMFSRNTYIVHPAAFTRTGLYSLLFHSRISDPSNISPDYTLFWTSFAPWQGIISNSDRYLQSRRK